MPLPKPDIDMSVIAGHLENLRSAVELFEKQLANGYQDELGPFVFARYQDALNLIDRAILMMSCESCQAPVSVMREAGNFCAPCAGEFAVCKQCGTDVIKDRALAYEGGLIHEACYGRREAPDKDGE